MTYTNLAPMVAATSYNWTEWSSKLVTWLSTDPWWPTLPNAYYAWYSNSSCTTFLYTWNGYPAPAQSDPTTISYYVKVHDSQWLWSTCSSAYAVSWRNLAPTAYHLSGTAPEWTNIVFTANGTDPWWWWTPFTWRWYTWWVCWWSIVLTWNIFTWLMADSWTTVWSYKIRDKNWSWSACAIATWTWTNVTPICTWISVSTWEAQTWTNTINCSDAWWWTVTGYRYANSDCSSTESNIWNSRSLYYWDNTTYNYSYKWLDANWWRSVCTWATFTWTNRNPTANDFLLSGSVWSYTVTWNWQTLASAADPAWWNDPLTASVFSQATKWTCSIASANIQYTPNSNQTWLDSCVIQINDWDWWTVNVTVSLSGIDTVLPGISTWYISSGATWNDWWWINYYKWIIDIRWDVSDNVWLSTWTCEYTTWISRLSANYSWTSTSGYCYKTWLNFTSDINIRFRIQDTSSNVTTWWIWVYKYDATAPIWWSFDINSNSTYTATWIVNLTNIVCPTDSLWVWLSWIYVGNSAGPTGNFYLWCPAVITWRILPAWNETKTVYMKWIDKLWNSWTDFTDNIILDTATPQVFTAVIYSWTTWYNSPNYYYKWIIDIRSQASDANGISWYTCEYNTWLSSRASANRDWTYCYKTWLNFTSDIIINFRVRDLADNLWTWNSATYLYDGAAPNLVFTWQTAANGTWQTSKTITWQMQITESWLNQFIWTFNSIPYSIYDSWLVAMYNFDNVSALWENSSIVKDISKYWNNGTIYSSTWTGNGKYNGAYNFGGQGANTYIDLWNSANLNPSKFTIWAWIKTTSNTNYYGYIYSNARDCCGTYNGIEFFVSNNDLKISIRSWSLYQLVAWSSVPANQRVYVSTTYNWSELRLYVNGQEVAAWTSTLWVGSPASYNSAIWWMWMAPWTYEFSWTIDEFRLYNRSLTSWEVNQLYKSNLNKFSTWQYFFTTTYTWMADGTYYYTWTAIDSVNNSSTTWRNLTIDSTAPMIVFTWSNPWQNTTWTTNNFTWQLQITELWTWLSQFVYTFNGTPYSVYDSGLLLMMNFDNVSALWENSTTAKAISQYNNAWTITLWNTFTWNWKYNGAVNFGSWNYIQMSQSLSLSWVNAFTFAHRVKTSKSAGQSYTISNAWWGDWYRFGLGVNSIWFLIWNWGAYTENTCGNAPLADWTRHHILWIFNRVNSVFQCYIDGQYAWSTAIQYYTWMQDAAPIVWMFTPWYPVFSWQVDEMRVYKRALSTWEIDLLYRSNLNKFSTWQWLFTDTRMCMLNWSYNYTWYASDFLVNNYSTGRKYNINITGYAIWSPLWISLWSVTASGNSQTLSWQFTWYFQVQDDRWTTWWYTTIQLPWSLPWTTLSWVNNPNFSIGISNIEFRSNTWIINLIAWTTTTWVYVSGWIVNYVNFAWARQYIMRDTRNNPYNCPTGTYGNKPWIKINIPARQSPNNYSWTLTFDINSP
jgi:hypothetical protein